jgi:hypothetical protein
MKKIILKISIGYEWHRGSLAVDHKWQFLKKIAQSVADSIEKKSNQDFQIIVDVGRLRGKHGGIILSGIKKRIRESHVLIFDVEEENKNVYLELGLALAAHEDLSDVFIFSQSVEKVASDLQGFLITCYEETDEYKLKDPKGFYAAIRSVLIKKLRENGYMCVDDSNKLEDTEID